MNTEGLPANVGSMEGLGLAPKRDACPTPQDLRDYARDADDHGNKLVPLSPQSLRALAAMIEMLEATEEGAKEAFGHVVEQKQAAEAGLENLRYLLDAAYADIRAAAWVHNQVQ